jgi:hypothetical protein
VTAATSNGLSIAKLNLAFALTVVLGVAAAIRFLPLGASSFPLNDGGLFVRMARDLSANGFLMPAFTSYNFETIPFAYPPLGLYLIALLGQAGAGDPVAVLRWLPAILSTASVLALYFMAAELLRSRWRGVAAAAAFATMPRSYMWLIGGGGVTRSLGLLLALLTLHQGILMLRRHQPANIAGTALLGGLTALAHPQAAVFLAVSFLALIAFRGRSVISIGQAALAGAGAMLVVSPWLFAVISAHGLPTLLSAAQTGLDPLNGAYQLVGVAFADSPVFDIITALGILGILVMIARRQWMLPTWLALTVLIDPRAGMTFATVPLALAVVPLLPELVSRMDSAQGAATTIETASMPALLRSHPAAAILLLLLLVVALSTASRTAINGTNPLYGLQPDHVAAMAWARQNSKSDAQFAVVTNRDWGSDYLSEWFPVVAERRSVATVQGSEWKGFPAYLHRLAMDRQLQDCAVRTAACLDDWLKGWDLQGIYFFLPKGQLYGPTSPSDCCPALRETLRASSRYRLVYDGPGATIFAVADR